MADNRFADSFLFRTDKGPVEVFTQPVEPRGPRSWLVPLLQLGDFLPGVGVENGGARVIRIGAARLGSDINTLRVIRADNVTPALLWHAVDYKFAPPIFALHELDALLDAYFHHFQPPARRRSA